MQPQLERSRWATAAKVKVFGSGSEPHIKANGKARMNLYLINQRLLWSRSLQMLHTNPRHHGVRVAACAMYPEQRSHCPGWPGIYWCCHLPSAGFLWRVWHPLARCPPGPPGGSCSASHAADPPRARSMVHRTHSRVSCRRFISGSVT